MSALPPAQTEPSVKGWWRSTNRSALALSVLMGLLFVFQLGLHAYTASATTDEGVHLMAGYRHLHCQDYAFNPEHPPLLKEIAALPLLGMQIRMPNGLPCDIGFTTKNDTFLLGEHFIPVNGGDRVLVPARLFAMQFGVLLAFLMSIAAWRVFGPWPSVAVMALLATEPMLVAHGSLVTTDMAITSTMFLSVMVMYASADWTPLRRILSMGLAFGLLLASKHSAVLILPLLALLALTDAWLRHRGRWRFSSHLLVPMLEFGAACVLALGVLWATYGFRYSAAPGMAQTVDLNTFLSSVGQPGAAQLMAAKVLPWIYRARLFPEAYMMGLTDIIGTSVRNTRLLGTFYTEGQWNFYPVAFSVKSSVGLLLLLPVGIAMLWRDKSKRRVLLFLLLPALGYFLVSASSKFTTHIRHILQVYPYCLMLAGFGLACLWRRGLVWRGLLAGLLGYQALTMVRTAPDYIPFANAFWGGSSGAYWVLPFDSTDWGQTPKRLSQYIAENRIRNCWFAGLIHPRSSAVIVPCKMLPDGRLWRENSITVDAVPRLLDGTIFLAQRATSSREGTTFAPLLAVQHEMAAGAVLAYTGKFDLPGVAGLSHAMVADQLVREKNFRAAVEQGARAVDLAEHDPRTWISYANALLASGDTKKASEALAKARRELDRNPDGFEFFAAARLSDLRRRIAETP